MHVLFVLFMIISFLLLPVVFSLLFELSKNSDRGLFNVEIFIFQILGILTFLR
jgi:hypothetical protein